MHCTIVGSLLSEKELLLRLAGPWLAGQPRPAFAEVEAALLALPVGSAIRFVASELTAWDSTLLAFLVKVRGLSAEQDLRLELEGLPPGVQRLLALAAAVPERAGAHKEIGRESFLAGVGAEALDFGRSSRQMLDFIGEATLAGFRLLRGGQRMRLADFGRLIQECGAGALPIVSLISLLVGLILAYVGAVQLVLFGAEIYVANLVGIAMVRVMGAVMAGIIMAGRTGAAFAAQLGTMQVNEEIDALQTMGISPMEFLVVPRMLALTMMMPLLCLYADLMGIVGGLLVGVTVLDLGLVEYWRQTVAAVRLNDLWIGLFQATLFGGLVAVAGCLRGLQCERSASAVGRAATSAVVTGIISIVVATALVTVICNVLGI
jgi:phospholipid/cholesterol/gamma-HCH transport system permease protein